MKSLLKPAFYFCLLAMVAADFYIWSQVPVNHTPYRLLSDFECVSPDKAGKVSIVPGDDSTLSRPGAQAVASLVSTSARSKTTANMPETVSKGSNSCRSRK